MSITKWAVLGVVAFLAIYVGMAAVSALNVEATSRTAMVAKQKANTSDFDAMKKTITQIAQTSKFEFDRLEEIFVKHAEARSGGEGKGAVMSWVQESVPNISSTTLNKLVNVIEEHRAAFNQRQKELVDLERENHLMFAKIPGGWVLSWLGRKPTNAQIVTSSETKKAFDTGEDNDTQLFPNQVENLNK